MAPFLEAAIIVYLVNSALLSVLCYIYGRTAFRTKASYPVALSFFSALLLIHSLGTALTYITMSPYFGEDAQPLMFSMGLTELFGLASLLKITL
jgi:hypothetical protein